MKGEDKNGIQNNPNRRINKHDRKNTRRIKNESIRIGGVYLCLSQIQCISHSKHITNSQLECNQD